MASLLQIKYFCLLAQNENMLQTAAMLGISQTTVSNLIASLEKDLGVRLFTRSNNAVRLNEAGSLYYTYCQSALAALENGRKAALDIAAPRLDIYFAAGASYVWKELLMRYRQAHPEHRLHHREEFGDRLCRLIVNREVDMAVLGSRCLKEPLLETIPLRDNKMYLCVSPEHPLAGREGVYLKELAGETLIRLSADSWLADFCDSLMRKKGIEPRYIMQCDYLLRPTLVKNGLGAVITTARGKASDLLAPNVYVPILDPEAVWQLYLCRNREALLTGAARCFWDYLREELT